MMNDNRFQTDRPSDHAHDAHGQTALVLVESLLHCLKERSILTTGDLLDIVTTAIEVQAELATETDGASAGMWRSHALLSCIAGSLHTDLVDLGIAQ